MPLTFQVKPHLALENTSKIDKKEVDSTLQFNCPAPLLHLWQEYEQILFDNSISIYGYAMVVERNEQYEVALYEENYLLVGDDGGGQGLFIQKEDKSLLLYYLDLGALGSMELYPTHQNLFDWIQENPDLDQYEETSENDILYEESDLFIVKVPEKRNQFLFKLKKELQLTESIVALSKNIDSLPFLVKKEFYPIKYKKEIMEINSQYGCLELTTKNGKIISID